MLSKEGTLPQAGPQEAGGGGGLGGTSSVIFRDRSFEYHIVHNFTKLVSAIPLDMFSTCF